MKARFLADYNFNGEIIDGLLRREPAIDLRSEHDAGLEGMPDPQVLAKAADEDRILITHDHRTMPRHFAELLSQRETPGVFIIPQQISVGAAIEELLLVWSASEADGWINRILYLPI